MRSNVLGSPKVSLESSERIPSSLNSLALATVATLISFGVVGLIFHFRLNTEIAPLVKSRPQIAEVSLSPYRIAPIIWILAGTAAIQTNKWVAQLGAGLVAAILAYAVLFPMWAGSGPSEIIAVTNDVMVYQLEMQILATFLNIVLVVAWIIKTKPSSG
jgi:hypothetical protein